MQEEAVSFFLYLLLSHYLTYFTGIETKTENVLYHFKLISISCLDISHSYVFILCHCCLLSWRRYLDTTVSKKSSTHYVISAQEILNPIVNLFIISLFTMRSFFTGCHQSPIQRNVSVQKLPVRPPQKSRIYHMHSDPRYPLRREPKQMLSSQYSIERLHTNQFQ